MIRRCLLGITALFLAIAASGSPSAAETHAGKDPRHDVVRFTPDGERAVPRVANGDIVRHRITYADDRLVAVIRFAELTRRTPVLWVGIPLTFPTGDGDRGYGEVELVIKRNGPRQPTAEYHGDVDTGCAVDSRVQYGRDRVRLAMPTSCFGSPRWIRAFAGAYRTDSLRRPSYFLSDSSPDNSGGKPGPRIERD